MPMRISSAARIPAPGEKVIEEWIGNANTGTDGFSIARMVAPPGWTEPYQTPEFDEATVVLSGAMRVEHEAGADVVGAGEVILVRAGERIRYSNPRDESCSYIAVCVPAFTAAKAHREE
jgi:mannose-6-phosphate isomerase-like protein (cupin superfamily)